MSPHEDTYYPPRRMHAIFAISSLALLAATVWIFYGESRRPWKRWQSEYRERLDLNARSPQVEQMTLPELTVDFHFRQVSRIDRCATCHQGIENPAAADLPQPLATHPKLDLYLGAKSPHPLIDFGCTVCHDGQGSAADFRWASHAPNDAQQRCRWRQSLGWSESKHWDAPMLAARFHQSRCLTCHTEVVDLETSRRCDGNLIAGYQLVRQYGCFACHEMATFQNVGRKVGPDLRRIAEKYSAADVADQIRNPADRLPSPRMPRLFGLYEHLKGATLADTKKSEEAEILAIADYLLSSSETNEGRRADHEADHLDPKPSAERGKRSFARQGCLACHRHDDFPQGRAMQGPDLTNLCKKYLPSSGRRWLTAWLQEPAQLSPQTLMPSLRWITLQEENGEKSPEPWADVAAYLIGDENRPVPTPRVPTSHPEFARRAIAKRGCAGCHDIPGCENFARIGPSLDGWASKPLALLAFDRIDEFVQKMSAEDPSGDFYREALLSHRREGFLWQKLDVPRSFDYGVVAQKPFDAQLKMGRFVLNDSQREAIITFILGLTSEKPGPRYAIPSNRRRQAILAGRRVLEKYACAECHMLELEQWTLRDGTVLRGVPQLDRLGVPAEDEDDDGRPIHFFTLWERTNIAGRPAVVGGADIVVPQEANASIRPAWGGTLAKMLYPVVLDDARRSGSSAAEVEAWGWLPPPLVHEGAIVRPEWLYRYLLDPVEIRPAAVLRMPKFPLSRDEARQLTDYFAAGSDADFPYAADSPRSTAPLDMDRMRKAMRLLLDREMYCAKCHRIGDSQPSGGNTTILAPRLDDVAERIRPEALRRWLADPKSVLPYTAMPAHFPASGEPLGQQLFPATSQEQFDAVLELLIRYQEYRNQQHRNDFQ